MRAVSLAILLLLCSAPVYDKDVREARSWLRQRTSAGEFRCAHILWDRESSWNPRAHNPYSGAHGIPQALPGSKMRSAGPRWRTHAPTQVRWGYHYVRGRYGTFCHALATQGAQGWY
jgi:hypothetical protein